MALQNIIIKLN